MDIFDARNSERETLQLQYPGLEFGREYVTTSTPTTQTGLVIDAWPTSNRMGLVLGTAEGSCH